MRIQHNIMAMNAYRNYSSNTSALAKNLEKLSSGYKINRAGDDAAGLAISEKMRAQITGLNTAQKNAKDGISLVQTAEGALTEVHDMLNRMVELADQSANGTYDNLTDRAQLQKEVDQLKSEINRIADSSNFNGIKLLDGSLTTGTSWTAGKAEVNLGAATVTGLGFLGDTTKATGIVAGDGSFILHKDGSNVGGTTFEVDLNGVGYKALTGGSTSITVTVGGAAVTISVSGSKTASDLATAVKNAIGSTGISINGVSYSVSVDGEKLKFEMDSTAAATITNAASFGGGFDVTVNIGAMTTGVLTGGSTGDSSNVTLATSNIKQGAPGTGEVYANASQDTAFTSATITDGKTLKVGDEYYIFALSKEKLAEARAASDSNKAYKVVDLTDLAKEKTGGGYELDTATHPQAVKDALSRLTQAASDNDMFIVGLTDDDYLTFKEKSTYSGSADLSNKKGLQDQFAVYDNVAFVVETPAKEIVGNSLTLQIGDTNEDFNQLKVDIKDMHAASIGIGDVDISTQEGAAAAIEKIKSAINFVSDVRGSLGATQNRLDHTINNLSVMVENIQDAEANIRDVDVAEEMMAYTKNNILVQSAQAMLAQANQVPQGVLQLLQ